MYMAFFVPFFQLTINKSNNNSYQNGEYYNIDHLTIFHNQISMFFEIFSDECKEGIPKSCTDERINDEFGKIHFSHTRRQGDKMSHHRNKSTY